MESCAVVVEASGRRGREWVGVRCGDFWGAAQGCRVELGEGRVGGGMGGGSGMERDGIEGVELEGDG